MASRSGTVVEPGPPPVTTLQGIFLVYNGADDSLVYSTGWVLFDKKDLVFVEGMVRDGNRWLFYYGGADKQVWCRHCAGTLSFSRVESYWPEFPRGRFIRKGSSPSFLCLRDSAGGNGTATFL